MSAQIADFQIKLTTETAQFNKDIEYAKKMLRGYTNEAIAANDSNADLTGSLKKITAQAKLFSAGFATVAGGIATAIATATAAGAYFITNQAEQAKSLEMMSTVSGETVESIQALAYATEQYGISGEKMSDILKDTNDKLGDYAQTGGGEFADFFDKILPKVGLTADALQKMSGQDALVAVKNAMDEANVPMKDQVFYLESIANDATALIPLLENNGKKLYELKNHYDNLNIAMSEIEIGQLKAMSQEITDIDAQLSGLFRKLGTQVTYSFLPAMISANTKLGLLTKGVEDYNIQLRALGVTQATLNVLMGKGSKEYHDELFQEYREAKERVAAYNGVDKKNLPSINPFGQSKNDWNNAQVELALAKEKYKSYQDSIIEYKKLINGAFDPFSDGNTSPEFPSFNYDDDTVYDDSKLKALDLQLANETEKMRLAHEQRLADIDAYNISAAELKQRGFASIEELRASYKTKEDAFYQQQLSDYNDQQDQQLANEIAKLKAAEDEKTKIAEERTKKQMSFYANLSTAMGNYYGDITGSHDNYVTKAINLSATLMDEEKRNSIKSIWSNTYDTAMKAYNSLASIPGVGPALGAAAAGVVIAAGGVYTAQVTGMAHNGIASIPDEGTWLLDKGERVYTNDSAVKLDKMYAAVMAMYSNNGTRISTNDAVYSSASTVSSGGSNVIVNLIEDASRAGTVEQSSDSDITTLDIRVAKLLQSSSSNTAQVMKSRYRNQQYGT